MVVVAWGQSEKGPCDHTLFLSAPLALLICDSGSSGGSGTPFPALLSVYLALALHVSVSVS